MPPRQWWQQQFRNLLKMQILRPHFRPTELETSFLGEFGSSSSLKTTANGPRELCHLEVRPSLPTTQTSLIVSFKWILRDQNITSLCCAQSCLTLCSPWTAAHWSPLSMRFSTQEYWSGLPCPPPGDLPNPGIKPASLTSPVLAAGFFTTLFFFTN